MSKKLLMRVVAVAAAIPLAFASFMLTATTAQAQGLSQITDASKVAYRTASAEEIAIIREMFDLDYYIAHNPDVVESVGASDFDSMFNHFITCGVFEGRTCTAAFDPSAYAAAYADAREACGSDILKYYVHYATIGKADGRTLTTLAACAQNKITVTALGDDSVKITPEVYALAKQLGLDNYKAVMEAKAIIDKEKAAGNNVVVTVSGSNSDASDPLPGYTKVATLMADNENEYDWVYIEIYRYEDEGSYGYGAYGETSEDFVLIAQYGDYSDAIDAPGEWNWIAEVLVEPWLTAGYEDYEEVGPVAVWTDVETDGELDMTALNTNGQIMYEDYYYDEAEVEVIDPVGPENTSYDVGFRFTGGDEDSVQFDVAVTGDNGFTLTESYDYQDDGLYAE